MAISQDRLITDADSDLPPGVHARVRLNEDDAFIPDLDAVETLIGGALVQAA